MLSRLWAGLAWRCPEDSLQVEENLVDPGDRLVSPLAERNQLLLDGFGGTNFNFRRQGVSGLDEVHIAQG